MLRRDPVTFVLQKLDQCSNCGYTVEYEDIDELRESDWASYLENK